MKFNTNSPSCPYPASSSSLLLLLIILTLLILLHTILIIRLLPLLLILLLPTPVLHIETALMAEALVPIEYVLVAEFRY